MVKKKKRVLVGIRLSRRTIRTLDALAGLREGRNTRGQVVEEAIRHLMDLEWGPHLRRALEEDQAEGEEAW